MQKRRPRYYMKLNPQSYWLFFREVGFFRKMMLEWLTGLEIGKVDDLVYAKLKKEGHVN